MTVVGGYEEALVTPVALCGVESYGFQLDQELVRAGFRHRTGLELEELTFREGDSGEVGGHSGLRAATNGVGSGLHGNTTD